MDITQLREMVLSNDYVDLIRNFQTSPEAFETLFSNLGAQLFGWGYGMVHVERSLYYEEPINFTGYASIPKLFTTLDTTSLEVSGILRVQTQPLLDFRGEGVIIGFIDTGINYTLPAFQTSDGRSRILRLWDQTIQSDDYPPGIFYGTEYTQEMLTEALGRENPLEYVPSVDTDGHGTSVAAIAAGSEDPANNFIGAAPRCDIAVVKLKPAKEYLKDFFQVPQSALAFQETDIMMGLRYLNDLSTELRKPLVICLCLGSNQGNHSGSSPLSGLLTFYSGFTGNYIIIAAGNEAGMAHHYYGSINRQGDITDVELLVNEKDTGFSLEMWGLSPELYSIGLVSPLGEVVPRIPPRLGRSTTIDFVLERTVVEIYYEVIESTSGNQLTLLRFSDPTPGLWRIRVYNDLYFNGIFNLWLPVTGFISPDTVFLSPNPDTTLTAPSNTVAPITVSTYDAHTGSLFINSSRGYTFSGNIKPDLAAPGVDVYGPNVNGRYTTHTGSSMAAAITAGAVALFVNWSISRNGPSYFSAQEVKGYLIRGASRTPGTLYPNREWGYGTLNLYQIFESLMVR